MDKKILYLDIETLPIVGATWRTRETDVIWVIKDWYICTLGYKWSHQKTAKVKSIHDFPLYKKDKFSDKALMEFAHNLISEADIIVAHNGDKFDIKKINTRLIINGFRPPSPYKTIDTLKLARKYFSFTSNKLNDLARYLGLGQKVKTGGSDLWKDYMADEERAKKLMNKYCKHDVVLLEQVHHKLRAWDTRNHFDNRDVCGSCASRQVQRRGYRRVGKYWKRKLQCQDCGWWGQSGLLTSKD